MSSSAIVLFEIVTEGYPSIVNKTFTDLALLLMLFAFVAVGQDSLYENILFANIIVETRVRSSRCKPKCSRPQTYTYVINFRVGTG